MKESPGTKAPELSVPGVVLAVLLLLVVVMAIAFYVAAQVVHTP